MRHVPYKGAANAAIDLAGGQIDVFMSSKATLAPFIKSGKVRLIGVTSREAQAAFPDVPPLIETLPGFSSETWVGVFAASGTPAATVDRLNRAINEVAASPDMRALLEPDGMRAVSVTPAAFSARVKQELAQWKKLAATKKIVLE